MIINQRAFRGSPETPIRKGWNHEWRESPRIVLDRSSTFIRRQSPLYKACSPGTTVYTRRNRTCPRASTSIDLRAGSSTTGCTRNWAFGERNVPSYATKPNRNNNTNYVRGPRNANWSRISVADQNSDGIPMPMYFCLPWHWLSSGRRPTRCRRSTVPLLNCVKQ